MTKLIPCILLAISLLFVTFSKAQAFSPEAGASAVLKVNANPEPKFDYREYTLRKFLAGFNSPLTPYALSFIRTADYYGLDWRMVPAISGVESTFGKAIPVGSYNAYGWAGGNYYFKSWTDSIKIVSKTLREDYINKGATSIAKIARIYSPPSTTWGSHVNYFMGKITPLPLSFDL